MTPDDSGMTPDAARAALAWLVEMGADEVVQEIPVDRFAAPVSKPAPVVAAPAVINRLPASSGVEDLASLDDVQAALTRFDACPLKKTATNLVYCDGNPKARVMVIGEAPGREEDLSGKPFVGKSGQLLDRMLACIGLSRASDDPATSVFITNMIFWRPPGNRTPTAQETLMCLPFVRRTIELVQPQFIVAMGNTPAQRLLGRSEGILKLRGKWYDHDAGGQIIPLLATLHPSYLLRQPGQKRLAWRDMLILKLALAGG